MTLPANGSVLNIDSQVIELNGLDYFCSFAYIPLLYAYKNTDGDDGFMPTSLLKRSLYVALEDYPILVGRLRQVQSGKYQVVVDSSNLNLPLFDEVQCDMDFAEFEAAKFNPTLLPDGAIMPSPFFTGGFDEGEIKLADIRVLKFKDNSGVAISISVAHSLMDGYGFNMFVHRWAEISQMLATDSALVDFGTSNAVFSRSVIQQAVPMPREPLLSALYKMFIPGGYLSRYVAWVSPGIRGKILESIHASSDNSLGCFHISSAAIEQLRQSVKATLATEQRISDNDILMASTIVAYAQGVIKHEAKHMESDLQGWLKGTLLCFGAKKPRTFVALEAVDIRPRMPNAQIASYTGNSAVAMMTLNPINLLQMPASLELLAQIALSVRKSLTGVTSEYISQTVHGDAEADDAFRPHIYKAHVSERLMATNFTRFNLYTTNFGWGIPQSVVPLNYKFPKFVSFFPAHPSEGGYYINIVAPEGVLREMQTNELWSASFKREY